MPLSKFALGVLESERKKLRAVHDKLDKAIADKDMRRMASLAQPAADIARRLVLLLDQQRIK